MALGVSGGGPLPHSAMLSPASIAFVALGVIWGSNFVFMKWASDTITPGQITFLRVLFGFLPILLYAAIRHVLDRRHLRYVHHFVVMSLLATSVYYFAFAAGTALLPSGIAVRSAGRSRCSPTSLLRPCSAANVFTRLRTLGVLIGFAGVLLIARPWDTTGSVDLAGVLYMLLGSASVGVSFVYARRFLSGLPIDPAALTTYQIGIALLLLTVITDYEDIAAIGDDPRGLIGLVVGLGILGTGGVHPLLRHRRSVGRRHCVERDVHPSSRGAAHRMGACR